MLFNQMKTGNGLVIQREHKKFATKLANLKNQKQSNNSGFRVSRGSRRMNTLKYKRKENNGELLAAPFPKNRDQEPVNQGFQVTPKDLEERDPIILTSQPVNLSEDVKALLRKSHKFVPTPRRPINEKASYVSFLKWRESMRWKWFHNKNKDPNDIDNDFTKKPWTEGTNKKAPIATDCPELEAFFNAIERDLKNPDLRRKVKSNLNRNQINFIKEVKEYYQGRGLRIRREDKGPRFVIEDADKEDERIQSELSNNTYYSEVNGISPATIVEGLRICMRCNCVKFKNKFYLPNRGVAMGACHACNFSDVWMGDITQKHLDTYPLSSLHFHLSGMTELTC